MSVHRWATLSIHRWDAAVSRPPRSSQHSAAVAFLFHSAAAHTGAVTPLAGRAALKCRVSVATHMSLHPDKCTPPNHRRRPGHASLVGIRVPAAVAGRPCSCGYMDLPT